MARGDLPALAGLDVADAPAVWRDLGFTVGAGDVVQLERVAVRLGRGSAGIGGWALESQTPVTGALDGIPTVAAPRLDPGAQPAHPNGATRIDHVVVATPDLDRTLGALASAGLEVSRMRETGLEGPRARQAFVWSGETILEVVGPREPAGEGPASLWGMVVVTPDPELLAAVAGDRVGAARAAVQPGRTIVPVRREAGSTVPLAFMTPHPG